MRMFHSRRFENVLHHIICIGFARYLFYDGSQYHVVRVVIMKACIRFGIAVWLMFCDEVHDIIIAHRLFLVFPYAISEINIVHHSTAMREE
ncbi:hypothetical protein D3C71_1880700 [compost metagenome]